jgi:hypothetical protein
MRPLAAERQIASNLAAFASNSSSVTG